MDRRIFIVGSVAILLAERVLASNFDATPDPSEDLLNGVVPGDAPAATSTMFMYAHHHVLYVPLDVLANPPLAGWRSYTSRVVPALGVNPELINVGKERHFHEVDLSYDQIVAIRETRPTVIDVFYKDKVVHQFHFDGPGSFERQVLELKETARREGLLTKL